jgi:hypothetical protein
VENKQYLNLGNFDHFVKKCPKLTAVQEATVRPIWSPCSSRKYHGSQKGRRKFSNLVDHSDDFDGKNAVASTRVMVQASFRELAVLRSDLE